MTAPSRGITDDSPQRERAKMKKPRTGAELGCGARWGRAVGWGAILARRPSNPTGARIVPKSIPLSGATKRAALGEGRGARLPPL